MVLTILERCLIDKELLNEIHPIITIFCIGILLLFIIGVIDFEKFNDKTRILDYMLYFLENILTFDFGEEININDYINDNRLKRKLKNTKVMVKKSILDGVGAWVYWGFFKSYIFIDRETFNLIKKFPLLLEKMLWHELYHTKRFKKKSNTELYANQYSLIKISERYGIIGAADSLSNLLCAYENYERYSELFFNEYIDCVTKNGIVNNKKFLRLR